MSHQTSATGSASSVFPHNPALFFQKTPELWPVVLFLQVAKFMGDNVVDAILGRF
jgi:hypothetical protein